MGQKYIFLQAYELYFTVMHRTILFEQIKILVHHVIQQVKWMKYVEYSSVKKEQTDRLS